MQYLQERELGALIASLHQVTQQSLPLLFFGAGLAGDAKSYAERLFSFPEVGPLQAGESVAAIQEPVRVAGADVTDDALSEIIEQTRGYPYFL